MPLLYPDRPTKWPIVDPNPSLGKSISNFNLTDYRNMAAIPALGYTIGWFGGMFVYLHYVFTTYLRTCNEFLPFLTYIFISTPISTSLSTYLASKPLRTPNAKFCAGLGIICGVFLAHLNSSQRLMGLMPNEAEVRAYGLASTEEINRYNDLSSVPNAELIGSTGSKN